MSPCHRVLLGSTQADRAVSLKLSNLDDWDIFQLVYIFNNFVEDDKWSHVHLRMFRDNGGQMSHRVPKWEKRIKVKTSAVQMVLGLRMPLKYKVYHPQLFKVVFLGHDERDGCGNGGLAAQCWRVVGWLILFACLSLLKIKLDRRSRKYTRVKRSGTCGVGQNYTNMHFAKTINC